MNAEIKQKWVEALRSGKYKQGRGLLRKDGSYCCLGVLCEVVKPGCLTVDGFYTDARGRICNNEVTPFEIMALAGLPDKKPSVESSGFQLTLAQLNDGNGSDPLSFLAIANLIEQQL